MHTAPHLAGPHDPVRATPARRPGTLRRTSTIDSRRPTGLDGRIVVDGRARDLRTGADGSITVEATCRLDALVDESARTLVEVSAGNDRAWVASLSGARTGQRFRHRLAEVVPPDLSETDPLLLLLLDDLPGSQLVAGYALHHSRHHSMQVHVEHLGPVTDVCAGWARDASILGQVRLVGEIPTPLGPPAPFLPDRPDLDAMAWHDTDPLAPHDVRRLRRLDIGPSPDRPDRFDIEVHFRDSHVDPGGVETVVHEYTVTGAVDRADRRLLELRPTARVLPWVECPQALGSAQRLVGREVAGLRSEVLVELVGTSTCTHLNDVLRTLADLGPILDDWPS